MAPKTKLSVYFLVISTFFLGGYLYNKHLTKNIETKNIETKIILDPNKVIILRTPGGMLELATIIVNEEYAWKTEWECPFIDCSFLGQTVSTIRIPAHYTYRIPLADEWRLEPENNHYVLTVPYYQPKLPVAVDLSKIQVWTTRGWLAPSSKVNQDALLKKLGPWLEKKANQERYIKMQENEAKKTIIEFATKWMQRQHKTEVPAEKIQVRVKK